MAPEIESSKIPDRRSKLRPAAPPGPPPSNRRPWCPNLQRCRVSGHISLTGGVRTRGDARRLARRDRRCRPASNSTDDALPRTMSAALQGNSCTFPRWFQARPRWAANVRSFGVTSLCKYSSRYARQPHFDRECKFSAPPPPPPRKSLILISLLRDLQALQTDDNDPGFDRQSLGGINNAYALCSAHTRVSTRNRSFMNVPRDMCENLAKFRPRLFFAPNRSLSFQIMSNVGWKCN